MDQLLPNLLVLGPGENVPEGCEDSLKIFLAGSIDLSNNSEYKWQEKFINGMKQIVSTEPGKGISPFNKYNWILVNPYCSLKNPVPTIMNQEWTMYKNWELEAYNWCDGIFLNFLKKSTNPITLFTLGYICQSGKVVVRLPDEYFQSGLVRLITTKFGVPCIPGKVGNILNVIQNFFSFIPKFQEVTKFNLPE